LHPEPPLRCRFDEQFGLHHLSTWTVAQGVLRTLIAKGVALAEGTILIEFSSNAIFTDTGASSLSSLSARGI